MKRTPILILMFVATGLLAAASMQIPGNVDIMGDLVLSGLSHLQINGASANDCISNGMENKLFYDTDCDDVRDPGEDDLSVDGGGGIPPEGFQVSLVADQTISVNTTWTKVNIDTETLDEGADFDTAGTDEYIAPYTGWYTFSATVSHAVAETMILGISVNNALPIVGGTGTSLSSTFHSSAWTVKLTAGDTVSLKALTSSQPAIIADAGFRGVASSTGGVDQPVAGSAGDLVLDGDCDARIGDVAGAVCVEPTGLMFVCQPTLGDCDTSAEWTLSGDGPNTGYQGDTHWNAWNTDSYAYVRKFTFSAQETGGRDLWFSPDGVYMYITGTAGDDINQYTLSTPWDVTTAAYTRVCCAIAASNPAGLAFTEDGTKMYWATTVPAALREYTLSTPWNISTAAFTTSVSVCAGGSNAVWANSNASQILVNCGSQVSSRYLLSTPGVLSTASLVETTTHTGWYDGIYAKPDGSMLFGTSAGAHNHLWGYAAANNYSFQGMMLVNYIARTSGGPNTCGSGQGIYIRNDGTRFYSICDSGQATHEGSLGLGDVNGNIGVGTPAPVRPLHVKDVIRLESRATAPTSPGQGDLYVDSVTAMLGFHDGSRWNYLGKFQDMNSHSVTCTNNAVGASPGALSITPALSLVRITNSDPDGCAITMVETGAVSGRIVELIVVSNAGGTVNFADTAGVTEIAGAFAAEINDAMRLNYVTDRFVELSRSNN